MKSLLMHALSQQDSGALFSTSGVYRHVLWRRWDVSKPSLLIIGLNPSTADAETDDPTIRRCKRFASDWGFGSIYMVNLFDFRATDPADMMASDKPVSSSNDEYISALAGSVTGILCAWGTSGQYRGRDKEVVELLRVQGRSLFCLGTNADGTPKHPLYIRANKLPELFK